jgi:DNA-binding response OmpR family regulator
MITHQGAAAPQILLVEDDANTSSVFTHALRAEGYSVAQASTVKEACVMLKENAVAVVLTDWVLPDGTAAVVCEEARQQNPKMPVILISGHADMRTLQISNCQVDVWLSKPVDTHRLLSTVDELLAQHAQHIA